MVLNVTTEQLIDTCERYMMQRYKHCHLKILLYAVLLILQIPLSLIKMIALDFVKNLYMTLAQMIWPVKYVLAFHKRVSNSS